MRRRIDLFHQLVYEDRGYYAIADYTDIFPNYDVYEKGSEDWIGCTNCSNYMPQIRLIVKNRMNYGRKKG